MSSIITPNGPGPEQPTPEQQKQGLAQHQMLRISSEIFITQMGNRGDRVKPGQVADIINLSVGSTQAYLQAIGIMDKE